jgi:hypothetical protein
MDKSVPGVVRVDNSGRSARIVGRIESTHRLAGLAGLAEPAEPAEAADG